MNNPKAKDNLKPFKKGFDERRNLKGVPKLPDLREAMAELLSQKTGDKTNLDAIVEALLKKAKAGDVRAAQELLDRGYGKSTQIIDATAKVTSYEIVIDTNPNAGPNNDKTE